MPKRTGLHEFIEFMGQHSPLRRAKLDFPGRPETRYLWGDVSVYELAMSLKQGAYFSHYTAMSIHDLTDQLPKTIYVNREQQPKPRTTGKLQQDRIDIAFRRKPRTSGCVAQYEDYRLCLLSGKHTGRLGVVEMLGPSGERIHVTGLERTLIDAAVRPFYAGGVFEVLNAYRRAKPGVEVTRVATILRALDYVYPYHQAIGCYMDKAGVYTGDELGLFRDLGFRFDFYLTFEIRRPVYIEDWHLYVPEGF